MAKLTGKDCKILLREFDLDLTFREAVASTSADELDTTVFENTARKAIAGFSEGEMSLAGLWESGADNIDAVLHDVLDDASPFPITVVPEGLTAGKRAFVLKAVPTNYDIESSVGDVTPADGEFSGAGGAKWGQLLFAAAVSASTNGTGFDNPSDGATTKGAMFVLHVTANGRDAGSVAVKIQDSADNVSFADVSPALNFASVNSGVKTSEIITLANGNSLRRYVRVVATVTGGTTGTYTIRVAYVRNF